MRVGGVNYQEVVLTSFTRTPASRNASKQSAREERVAISAKDILAHAPVTSKYVTAGSITLRDLCAAAVEQSDNLAAAHAEIGAALTQYSPERARERYVDCDSVTC